MADGFRVTESGGRRVTEDGSPRITERFVSASFSLSASGSSAFASDVSKPGNFEWTGPGGVMFLALKRIYAVFSLSGVGSASFSPEIAGEL